jgi:uncharacterized membrane protein
MLTLQQQNAVLTFLAQTQAQTLASALDHIYDQNICDNSVRIYDSACIAQIFNTLANTYTISDSDQLSYTFTADDVLNELSMLDTEYRDCVHEWLMQYSDDLSVAIYGKTYAQYCAEVEAQFAAMRTKYNFN